MNWNYHIIVLVVLLGLAVAAPALQDDVAITSYTNSRPSPNSYEFSYKLSDGSSRLERGELQNPDTDHPALYVSGEYSWRTLDGKRYIVTYTADENGYKPVVREEIIVSGIPSGVVASLLG